LPLNAIKEVDMMEIRKRVLHWIIRLGMDGTLDLD
jgi:hypothetical protein